MSLTKQERAEISEDRFADSGASGSETQIGDDIPDDKVRYVWKIEVGNPAASADVLTIYTGEATNKTRTTKKTYPIPANDTIPVGGDVEDPIMICRPNTSVSPTQDNQIYLAHGTAAMHVHMEYYDL